MNKNRLLEKIYYIIKIIVAFLINIVKRQNMQENIWLIGSGDDCFENNVKAFYEYIKHDPKINVYWVTSSEAYHLLRNKIPKEYLIIRGSILNFVYAFNANVAVYSHSDFDVAPGIYRIIKRKTILVNINHGFDGIKKLEQNCYQKTVYDIIIAASEYEKKFKLEHYVVEESAIKVTGFSRFDHFEIKANAENNLILIMPTWRDWYNSLGEDNLKRTSLVINYLKLLEKLSICLEDRKYEIVFILHPYLEKISTIYNHFKENKKINILSSNQDIQRYILKAKLLITDYSSISWDFMYMNKPVLYFWFDYEEYVSKRGLYVNEKSFSYIAFDIEHLLKHIENIIDKDIWESKDRTNYFDFFDQNNSKRIYNVITKFENDKKKK